MEAVLAQLGAHSKGIILAEYWGSFGGALIYKELHVLPIQINRTLILFKNLSPLKRIRRSIIAAKYACSRSIISACCWIVLGGLFTPPAHAWDLYAQAAVAADLNPNKYTTLECHQYCQYVEKRFFVPGAMDHVALGLESGPVYLSVQHLSAIEDGVRGRGLTWLEVGVKVKMIESK